MPVWPLVDNVTAVKVVLILYVVGFVLQLAGAVGVIQDVRTSIGNMRQFKSDLSAADETAQEHRQMIADIGNKPRGYGLEAAMSKLTDAIGEAAVEQTGRAPAEQRRALLKYVTAQNDMSKPRRWVPVGLLLGGLVVGFVGNVLSLYL
jgi:hypothetical protein